MKFKETAIWTDKQTDNYNKNNDSIKYFLNTKFGDIIATNGNQERFKMND